MTEKKWSFFILWVTGTLIAISLFLPGAKFLYEWHRSSDSSYIWKVLFRWQTIYQSWIEVLIALAGSSGILWQIWSEKEKEAKRRKRTLNSLRISMVSFLSDAILFLEKDIEFYYRIYNRMNFYQHPPPFDGHFLAGNFRGADRLDPDILNILREFSEYAEGAALRAVELLIRQSQVYTARSKNIKNNSGIEHSHYDLLKIIVDAISLYQRIEYFFPYARKAASEPAYIIKPEDLKLRVIHLCPKAEGDREMQRLIHSEAEQSLELAAMTAE